MESVALSGLDIAIILVIIIITLILGFGNFRKSKSSEHFMIANRSIPAWAAGLAVMGTYTSSISYIATPGKAFDANWHPLIFALCILPVAWFVGKYIIKYYWKMNLISVYEFLEQKLGKWARGYAGLAFILYSIGRIAVITYLAGLLLSAFLPFSIDYLMLGIGIITLVYTLVGGMHAVIWTDVFQSIIMIAGILYCVVFLTYTIFGGQHPEMVKALTASKFSLGGLKLSLSSRTIWVMIIYGITENVRNLMADQNYVQKYASVGSIKEAKKSIWTAMLIYIPLTALFLYLGTTLFAFYSNGGLPPTISKGDQVFPYFIAHELPIGLKGLVISAILAAAMSTISSALNSSATVSFIDFFKRYFKPNIGERYDMVFLRSATVFWGIWGTGLSVLMIHAKSALDVWWEISGIFGGAILGLFIIAFLRPYLKTWLGILGIIINILSIAWATFARNLPANWAWMDCTLDPIIIGAFGTAMMIVMVFLIAYFIPSGQMERESAYSK